jgi:SAM-dependent methyltransferase
MDFSTSPDLLDRFEQLCKTRPDIRVMSWIMGQEKVPEWINSVGVCQEEILRSVSPPVPPLELRQIVAAPEPEPFLWTGYIDSRQMVRIFNQYCRRDNPKVLDFGCGCGRMTRYLPGVSGCDVNPDLVTWCQKNLSGATTRLNGKKPPLPYDDETFDLIFSLSIFSHLPESLLGRWLHDLWRVLTPGGILILTTHGITALNIIQNSQVHRDLFQMSVNEADTLLKTLEKESFVFRAYPKNVLEIAQAGDEYGNTFIHPAYIQKMWDTDNFHLEAFLPGGLRGWQDITVLKKIEKNRT